ncbi:MAG: hypothetical protein KDJ20_07060 [Hyphomicrobiales bacterium]|nr:hypothetical protein [Hyphomicrobiales bacterium]MCC2108718.1 hypothetical protein [Hyphomicrobiales bacterium]
MRTRAANSASLLRCADAAGYGAVSFTEDEPRIHSASRPRGIWRAILAIFFPRI